MKTFSVCALVATATSAAQHAPTRNPPELLPSHVDSDSITTSSEHQASATPSLEWALHKSADGSHPSANEQAMMWLMNRARSNPTLEGQFLANTGDPRVNSAISFFGVDLDIMQAEFAAIQARPPVAFDRRIYEGSLVHSLDLIERDAQDHNNQFDRIEDAGFFLSGGNASVFSYSESPVHAHSGFNIDWGGGGGDGMQAGRGHRVGLMSSGSFVHTNTGISMVPVTDSQKSVGPIVTSIGYARASSNPQHQSTHFNKFLVGTVWEDSNENGIYDSGEGLSGVTVTPDEGTYFAITGDAGGYAIPITANRLYTIDFSGGDLSSPEQRTVSVQGESALVVWNPEDNYSEPLPPQLIAPTLSIGIGADGATVSWTAIDTQTYTIQFSTNAVSWTDDNRTVSSDGSTNSFLITSSEIDQNQLFRVQTDFESE